MFQGSYLVNPHGSAKRTTGVTAGVYAILAQLRAACAAQFWLVRVPVEPSPFRGAIPKCGPSPRWKSHSLHVAERFFAMLGIAVLRICAGAHRARNCDNHLLGWGARARVAQTQSVVPPPP